MEVHLDNLQAKFEYHDLYLIFKVMVAILIVVEIVSAQFLPSSNLVQRLIFTSVGQS